MGKHPGDGKKSGPLAHNFNLLDSNGLIRRMHTEMSPNEMCSSFEVYDRPMFNDGLVTCTSAKPTPNTFGVRWHVLQQNLHQIHSVSITRTCCGPNNRNMRSVCRQDATLSAAFGAGSLLDNGLDNATLRLNKRFALFFTTHVVSFLIQMNSRGCINLFNVWPRGKNRFRVAVRPRNPPPE